MVHPKCVANTQTFVYWIEFVWAPAASLLLPIFQTTILYWLRAYWGMSIEGSALPRGFALFIFSTTATERMSMSNCTRNCNSILFFSISAFYPRIQHGTSSLFGGIPPSPYTHIWTKKRQLTFLEGKIRHSQSLNIPVRFYHSFPISFFTQSSKISQIIWNIYIYIYEHIFPSQELFLFYFPIIQYKKRKRFSYNWGSEISWKEEKLGMILWKQYIQKLIQLLYPSITIDKFALMGKLPRE